MRSSITKGLWLGLANLVLVALLIAISEGVRYLPQIMVTVVVIGAGPALGVGALCGWIGGQLERWRRLVITAVPMGVVIALGMLSEPALVEIAVLPTLLLSLALEYATRPNLVVKESAPSPWSPTMLGIVLGLANVAVVATLLAIYVTRIEPYHRIAGREIHPPFGLHFAALVLCLGAIPGGVIGALSGFLAKHLRPYHVLTRLVGIGSVSVSGVCALGALADAPVLVAPALLPTLLAVAVLERLTRPIAPVPSARVLRGA